MSDSTSPGAELPVQLRAADGWMLHGLACVPAGTCHGGVVLVHGGNHELDAFTYGLSVPAMLVAAGLACVRIDIRGRGASRHDVDYHELAPAVRRGVAHDVRAALDYLALVVGADAARLGVVGEQDTASATATAAAGDPRVQALVLMSPRVGASAMAALRARAVPTYALVTKEDRVALRDAVAAYLAGPELTSRLDVFAGLGFGTTMFAARAFEQPTEAPLEALICGWLAARLGGAH